MKHNLKEILLVGLFAIAAFCATAQAGQMQKFDAWLAKFSHEARASGISPQTLGQILPRVAFVPKVIKLDRKQPETRMSFGAYASRIVSKSRIKRGRELLEDNKEILRKVEKKYGVPPSVIVALWAIESNYGDLQGHFDLFDSLATLAFEGRRASFFKKELINALKIADQGKIEIDRLEGSWAGAMGQCQFMPSTYLHYAVDFDGDGVKDIWRNKGDIFASIANYIRAEGWKPGWRWGREVKLTKKIPENQTGLDTQKDLSVWKEWGVKGRWGHDLPSDKIQASLIMPDGPSGRAFLVYDNFRVFMRWNRSTYFATSVGLLANQIH